MSIHNILVDTKQLLSDEKKWIKGSDAVNGHGDYVFATSKDACAWCLAGAIEKECDGSDRDISLRKTCKVQDWVDEHLYQVGTMEEFNDDPNTTHKDMMLMLDNLIAKSQEKGV